MQDNPTLNREHIDRIRSVAQLRSVRRGEVEGRNNSILEFMQPFPTDTHDASRPELAWRSVPRSVRKPEPYSQARSITPVTMSQERRPSP